MPGVVAYIDQTVQVGQESAAGTPTPANRRLQQVLLEFGDEVNTLQFNPTGRRLDSLSLLNERWTTLAASGPLSYTEGLLLIEAWLGAVSPSTQGTLGKKRVYDLPLTGAIAAKTLTAQWGDATYVNQAAYGLITSYGEKFSREKGGELSGVAGIAQLLLAGGTSFTNSPTTLQLAPVIGPHLNYYLDTTGANLGTTQITEEVLDSTWEVKDLQKPFWAADRTQGSWKKPISNDNGGYTAKLSLAESAVTRAIDASLSLGRTYFLRIENKGDNIDNSQTLTITGGPAGGTFTLTYKGQTTTAIAYNATNTTVQTALAALSSIGAGNVVVTGGPGPATPWVVDFSAGLLQNDASAMTHADSFTGGASPALGIVALQTPYQATRDIAVKLMKRNKWGNKNSVYARDYEFDIVEDATWGHGLLLTSVTALATL